MKPYNLLSTCRVLLGVTLIALVQPLQAASLNLTQVFPDFLVNMSGGDNTYEYDSGTETLTITGLITSYTETEGGTQFNAINSGSFELTASFSNLTGCPGVNCDADVSGSFKLFGEIYDALWFAPINGNLIYDGFNGTGGFTPGGDPDGLLQGSLVDFGWADAGNGTGNIEFTFNNTLGILATGTLTEGGNPDGYESGAMTLNVNTSDMIDFDTLLTNTWSGTGVGDVWVPVPAAIWLFGSGLVGLLGIGARRQRSI